MSGKTCVYCDRPVVARMMCRRHYSAWYYRKGELAAEAKPEQCPVDGCLRLSGPRIPTCPKHRVIARKWGLDVDGLNRWATLTECMTCGSTYRLHVDHDHAHCQTGCSECVRGVLCLGCNVALGHAKDDPTTLRALADYVEAWRKL